MEESSNRKELSSRKNGGTDAGIRRWDECWDMRWNWALAGLPAEMLVEVAVD